MKKQHALKRYLAENGEPKEYRYKLLLWDHLDLDFKTLTFYLKENVSENINDEIIGLDETNFSYYDFQYIENGSVPNGREIISIRPTNE